MTKNDRLVIRCSDETKTAFQMYAAAYENQAEALAALLEAYGSEPQDVEVVNFDVEF